MPKSKKNKPTVTDETPSELLTVKDVRAAIRIVRKHLNEEDLRVAQWVLGLYYGNDPAEQKQQPDMSISDDYLKKLAEKYFPKGKGLERYQP